MPRLDKFIETQSRMVFAGEVGEGEELFNGHRVSGGR